MVYTTLPPHPFTRLRDPSGGELVKRAAPEGEAPNKKLILIRKFALTILILLFGSASSLGAQDVKKMVPRQPVLEAAMDSVITVLEETGLNSTFDEVDAVRKNGAVDISLYGQSLLTADEIANAVCQSSQAVPTAVAKEGNNILKYMLFLASRAVLQKGIVAPIVITSGNYTQSEVDHRHFHDFRDYSKLWMLGYANNTVNRRSNSVRTEFFTLC